MSPHIRLALIAIAPLFAAASQAPTATSPVAMQTVTMDNYRYGPNPLHLRAGQPVVLHFVNVSGKSHDFTAPAFFAKASIAPADQARIVRGKLFLDAGASTDLRLTPRAGTYKVKCTRPFHTMLGMTGTLVVD